MKAKQDETVLIIFVLILFLVLCSYSCCPIHHSDAYHIVQQGDTLEEISTYYYGTEMNAKLIEEANYLKWKDQDLKVGQKLKIPRKR